MMLGMRGGGGGGAWTLKWMNWGIQILYFHSSLAIKLWESIFAFCFYFYSNDKWIDSLPSRNLLCSTKYGVHPHNECPRIYKQNVILERCILSSYIQAHDVKRKWGNWKKPKIRQFYLIILIACCWSVAQFGCLISTSWKAKLDGKL